jgi:4-amino-4-deoxy-L-arabinose transferase-like glycosyltransferase
MAPGAPRLRIVGLNAPELPASGTPPTPPTPPDAPYAPWRRREARPVNLGDPYFVRSTRLLDFLLALILGVGAMVSVALTYHGIGHSWDEALYLRPAASAGQWVMDLVRGAQNILSPGAIDQAWGLSSVTGDDPLHPEVAPLPKAVIGVGISLLTGYGIPEMLAMRLPIAIVFGLTVALLLVLGSRSYGRLAGFVGAMAYWLMPRVFGHAHIAASETLFAFTVVLLAYAYLLGIRHPWGAILTAFAFALAFDTKVTALLLPLPLLLWGQFYYRRDYASNIFAIALGSPLIALGLWPWLWYDPLVRLAEYVKFYAAHQSTAVFYMGRMWGYIYGPPAPWHYPLVITSIAVPVWTLVLMVIGILAALWQWRRRSVPMLFLLFAATIIGFCSMPNAPKYDGERLFFGAFPFLALLTGGGFRFVDDYLVRLADARKSWARWARRMLIVIILVAIGWNVRTLVVVHPDELNFFNSIIGGARGAYEKGFETSYWGEAVNEDVIDYLNSLSEPGTKFKPLALNELVFLNLQGWGMLSTDATYVAASDPFDYYVLQVRQGFFGRVERALHFGAEPLRVFSAQGVPKIEVFRGDALTTRGLARGASAAALKEPRGAPSAAPETSERPVTTGPAVMREDAGTSGSALTSRTLENLPVAAAVTATSASATTPKQPEGLREQHPEHHASPSPQRESTSATQEVSHGSKGRVNALQGH